MNLPTSTGLFVGRDDELSQIGTLFADPNCHLLTLVGPGGVGKTRLALEAARRQEYPDGVHFVPLQPLTSADYIVSTIADAVGIQFSPGGDLRHQLLDYFRHRSLLLVLDNLEQLLDGVTLLSEILDAAPGVSILATSRERLSLREEWVLEVEGLSYPINDDEPDPAQHSAVALFEQRARQTKLSFELVDPQRSAVGRICRMVGGMPLGVELAAAWVRALSCEAIADEIARSLDILETSTRNVEPRHRTIRAVFEPTWQRLTNAERDTFMRLSVFRGGFTRDAAEAVAGASLRTLTALVDKSLVRVNANGRYDMQEILRQYAMAKLTADAASTSAERHLTYFLKLTEVDDRERDPAWYEHLNPDLDNFRAALAWALHRQDAEKGLRLAASLSWFFAEQSHAREGLTWLEHMLHISQDVPPSVRAKALARAGETAAMLADYEYAKTLARQALDLARAVDDHSSIAMSLATLGFYSGWNQYSVQAAEMLDESLALLRQLADPVALADVLRRCSRVACTQGEYEYARALLEEALQTDRATNNSGSAAWTLLLIAYLLLDFDHAPDEAAPYFERSLSLFRKSRNPFGAAFALTMLGWRALDIQDYSQAQKRFSEALVLLRDSSPNHPDVDSCTCGIAFLARTRGMPERAAKLTSWAEAWVQAPELIAERKRFDDEVEAIRAQLDPAVFAVAWAAGKALTREQVIAYALETAEMSTETPLGEPPPASSLADPLTERELEVLHLVADGLSNGEIADQLVLARSTIKWYVNQIFSKLDARSRTQAVARARSLGVIA